MMMMMKQGCGLSFFLFLLVIDWIMCRTVSEGKTGIKWLMKTQLENLNYADAIVLLHGIKNS